VEFREKKLQDDVGVEKERERRRERLFFS